MAIPKKLFTFLKEYRKQIRLIAIVSILPLAMIFKTILEGSIPFWHDPARDMVHATENLQDITLLGPTTGIQGVFYGPHSIWALSASILISPDPRLAVILVQVLPYLLFVPFSLYAMRKLFSSNMWLGIWIFMALALRSYITQPWHPHITPSLLVLLAAIITMPSSVPVIAVGFLAGIISNLHFALGIVIIISTGLFVLLHKGKPGLKQLRQSITYGLSVLVAFVPTILFELRNDFLQSRSLLNMFFASYTGGEVELQRLSKIVVIKMFFETIAEFLKIPLWGAPVIFIIMLYSVYKIVRTQTLKSEETRLLTWIGLFSLVMGFFYLGGKTPVWKYHFIGIQVFLSLIIGWLTLKSGKWRIATWTWISFVVMAQFVSLFKSFWIKPLELDGLAGKEYVVEHVFEESNGNFGYAAYSSAIYAYDYDYLFNWKESKYGFEAKKDEHLETVYVVIPPDTGVDIETDYVSYKTPKDDYETIDVWESPSGVRVYKRVQVE